MGASLLRAGSDEGGGTVNQTQTDPPLSRAGSLPQEIYGAHKFYVRRRSTVGASLLAMAPCQPPQILTDRMSSRASSLPQVRARPIIPTTHAPVARELAPAGLRSGPKPATPFVQVHRIARFCGGCATEREQAPSPRVVGASYRSVVGGGIDFYSWGVAGFGWWLGFAARSQRKCTVE